MATVNFYLKNPSTDKESSIYLRYRYNGNTLKYYLQHKIHPKDWNPNTQRVRKSYTGDEKDSTRFNDYLKKVGDEITGCHRDAVAQNINATNEYLRNQLNNKLNVRKEKEKTFFDYYDEFIESKETVVHQRTIQKYNTLKTHLLAFQRKFKTNITFEQIDMKFYDRLISWYIKDQQILNNTIGKYISTLKTFLHWATDRDYNNRTVFMKFKVAKDETDIIYLTENELMKLYEYDFSNNKKLEQVRDTFCFGCFTGLRYSDIANLRRENIKEDSIQLTIKKTREKMIIPLIDYSRELLGKYDNRLPVISNQKTNDYLKELGKIAEIDTSVIITRYRGPKAIEIKEPKYNFISSHTARRTFVTLSLEKGMRAEMVMSITGHKEYKTFKKYIKITNKVKLVEMQRVWNREPELKAV